MTMDRDFFAALDPNFLTKSNRRWSIDPTLNECEDDGYDQYGYPIPETPELKPCEACGDYVEERLEFVGGEFNGKLLCRECYEYNVEEAAIEAEKMKIAS